MTHYHYMNGMRGFIPDTNNVHDSKESALMFAETVFQDSICADCFQSMRDDLAIAGDHDFDTSCEKEVYPGAVCMAGAGYVSIDACDGCEVEDDD